MMETLNELAQLRGSGFGQPCPRHGLKLLYWFAKECVSFDNGNIMLSECDPANGDFGFHLFENRQYGPMNKLRKYPDRGYIYYVVGNLNSKKYPKAEKLPDYVSKDKYIDQNNSNRDRIIVSLSKKRLFHRVYVTEHYDPNATYRISRGLLMIIRDMSLDKFLEEMGYNPQTTSTDSPDSTAITPSPSDLHDDESETESSDTKPLIEDDTSTRKPSKKESCNGCCTIL